ncbi:MAG: carboxyl transferase domain-containing protein, partial [Candidatus Adiutricales bacterium]
MTWQPEVDEIKQRKKLAENMGGPEGIARQRKRGKLTVRERVDLLADPGSFREWGVLGGRGIYEDDKLTGFTPKASVQGMLKLNGRKIIVTAGDFTVRG